MKLYRALSVSALSLVTTVALAAGNAPATSSEVPATNAAAAPASSSPSNATVASPDAMAAPAPSTDAKSAKKSVKKKGKKHGAKHSFHAVKKLKQHS